MRAAMYRRTGAARDVLELVDRDIPDPGAGEVRVRVAFSGVNPSDVKSRAGLRSATLPFPEIVPHSDGAGVIDATGPGVDAARVGERVWLWNAAWGRAFGTAAQWVCLPQAQAVPLPAPVQLAEGACLGIPALTAAQAVLRDGGVSGKAVLIAGGAGAVGHYAVQMARLLGAREVIATVSSADKAQRAREAGAHHVINYRTDDVREAVWQLTANRGVDRIIEVDGAANLSLDLTVIAPDGLIVVYGSGAPEIAVPFAPSILKNVRYAFFVVYHLNAHDRAQATTQLQGWLDDDALIHVLDRTYALADIAAAHERVESGAAIGNVVIDCG
jgi:NADPH2:quinone reductase